jgi:predicted  nucleic acid-binding Zn-ribbon protein
MSNEVRFPYREVNEFTKTLKAFSKELETSKQSMDSAIKKCGNEWKDDKYEEFKSEFGKHIDKLKPLSEELIRVQKHADNVWMPIIDDYLKNRVR